MIISLTYCTQDLRVKIDNVSFELEHLFKCDRNTFSPTTPIHKTFMDLKASLRETIKRQTFGTIPKGLIVHDGQLLI